MKKLIISTMLTLSLVVIQIPPSRAADIGPKVEVAFVLHTTESMAELIEGAKQKIWTIARHMASGRPSPAIKLGLIGYRDRFDEYVTLPYDLTEDIDLMYGHLIEFKAAGGGDMPESVNQALYEAVTKLTWDKDPKTLKIIFLVGDAPPHMDYPGEMKYPEIVQLAARSGIIVNSIQCGHHTVTTPVWKDIAAKSGGAFVQIDQSGGMKKFVTPVDAELTRLSRELAATAVPYGNAARQSEVRGKMAAADRADVDRIAYLNLERAEFGAKAVVTGLGELIWDVVNQKVKLEDIPESDLPRALQGTSLEERKTFVADQVSKRKGLQVRVDELSKQRDVQVKAEITKLAESGVRDSFDKAIAEMIHTQAKRMGIDYDISLRD